MNLIGASGGSSDLKKTLLWENPSPTSTRGDGIIYAEIGGYDYLLIEYKEYYTKTDGAVFTTILKNEVPAGAYKNPNNLFYTIGGLCATYDGTTYARAVKIRDDTTDRFYIGSAMIDNSSSASTAHCIPLKVYGFNAKFK